MIRVHANILAILVSALSVASIFMTHTLFTVVKNVQFETRVMKKEYSQSVSFISTHKKSGRTDHWHDLSSCGVDNAATTMHVGMLGDDWPPFSPLKLEQKVEMVVEESVHYVAGGSGSKDEWEYQRGFGFDGAARLGADNRTFAVSLYHQEHCLLYFHAQLTDRGTTKDDSSAGRFAHHQHCLNYLRQQALCHPDLTLEPGDFATRDFDVDRVGQSHVCRDFDMAWDHNAEGWLQLEWYQFLKDSRILNFVPHVSTWLDLPGWRMPTGRRDLNPHLPPFKISLVHRDNVINYPKAYVLTADSFVSYPLISVEITAHMYLKDRSRR